MPKANGFALLKKYTELPFEVVFVTSFDQYAINAIKFSALDYLLKPIDPKELVTAVHKVNVQKSHPSMDQFQMLKDHYQHKGSTFN